MRHVTPVRAPPTTPGNPLVTLGAPTLHTGVLDALGGEIAAGALPAGSVLGLEPLAERFGVSRTVVREAVRVLESLGFVETRRRVGVTVQARERWNVLDPRVVRWRLGGAGRAEQWRSLTALRAGVEPVAAAAAARRARPEQARRLLELAEEMERLGAAGDLAAFGEADVAFHELVLRASGNEMLAALSGMVAEVLRGRTEHLLMPEHPEPAARALHARVARAVAARDSAAAESAMRAIVAEVQTAIEEATGDG
ncbi:FadR/GntR family transcriptional regulator [Kineococcus sp. SYSU DK005]|uniref:FadR/GntR family transcriptional regulator n=1 Tax=Kineococcus sp. SYSU DK005 TaxID=3383126 RepID=UPI003D7DA449